MKPAVRNILASLSAGLLIALFAIILTAEKAGEQNRPCQGLKVTIADSARLSFVSESDIAGYMDEYGPYVGARMPDIDLGRIEAILSNKSAILGSEAWLDRDGYVHIEVRQREPAIRFQKGAEGFYADEKGFIFPLQESYTSRVPIIDGAIPLSTEKGFKGEPATDAEKLWLERIIRLVAYMQQGGWTAFISQITVLKSGDLEMVPADGKEKFIFGSPTGIEAKFKRIKTYYEAVVPSREAGYYSTVDVRFDKQIICKK